MRSSTDLDLNGVFVPKPVKNILRTQKFDSKNIAQIQKGITTTTIMGQQSIISSRDQRVRVERTDEYPFHSIGFLYMEFYGPNNQVLAYNGTATLVSQNVIVTCAHNVFSKQFRREASRVTFYPGLNGNMHFGRSINIRKPYLYSQGYPNSRTSSIQQKDNDYAFLVLEQSVQEGIRPLPIIVDYPQKNRYIGIYGYPGDKNQLNRPLIYMYGMVGGFQLDTSTNILRYTLDTNEGQSGSAIIVFQNNGIIGIIGLHTLGDQYLRFNSGNRLTTEKMNYINRRMAQSFGQQLQFFVVQGN